MQKGTAVLTISSLYCITDNQTILKETTYKGVWRKLNVSSPFMCWVLGGQTCQAFQVHICNIGLRMCTLPRADHSACGAAMCTCVGASVSGPDAVDPSGFPKSGAINVCHPGFASTAWLSACTAVPRRGVVRFAGGSCMPPKWRHQKVGTILARKHMCDGN